MKQLETKNQKLFNNVMNSYKEIGIDMLINYEKINNKIVNNKKASYKIQNKDQKIKELENSFKNFDACKLKKTSTNFVYFFGNINSNRVVAISSRVGKYGQCLSVNDVSVVLSSCSLIYIIIFILFYIYICLKKKC